MSHQLKWMALGAVLAVFGLIAYTVTGMPVAAGTEQEQTGTSEAGTHVLRFDVAEDATRFVFDEAPVHEDGLPAYGNAFVTQGYIYEPGTLNGSNGVLKDGTPEFPEKVIGEWTCRGWFVGDGAHTESGPWVITTQLYNFGEAYGDVTLVTEGYEIADLNEAIERAITGGTGPYKAAQGEGTQILLGFNATEGVNSRFELHVQQH
jgi:hypothetical protein